MSYQLVRSHRLYLTTENRDVNDTPYQVRFEIGNNLIFLDDPATQRMKISLMNFCCNCMWFEVNLRNNSVIFTNNVSEVSTPITIPSRQQPPTLHSPCAHCEYLRYSFTLEALQRDGHRLYDSPALVSSFIVNLALCSSVGITTGAFNGSQ
jgi:hypothetical protein